MAWSDAGQRAETLPVARLRCDFAVSNRPAVSTPETATCRGRGQSLTASGLSYDQVSSKSPDSVSPKAKSVSERIWQMSHSMRPNPGPVSHTLISQALVLQEVSRPCHECNAWQLSLPMRPHTLTAR